MASDRVTVTIEAGVADVRLNRPDKLNALDGRLIAAIAGAGEALKSDRAVANHASVWLVSGPGEARAGSAANSESVDVMTGSRSRPVALLRCLEDQASASPHQNRPYAPPVEAKVPGQSSSPAGRRPARPGRARGPAPACRCPEPPVRSLTRPLRR